MNLRWLDIATGLRAHPRGTRLRLARRLVPHPLDGGLDRGIALPVGQRADFRLRLDDQTLCVQDFGSHYEAFLDGHEGSEAAAAADALGAGAAAGALLALLVGGTREAALIGALLGAALGHEEV